MKFAVLGAGLQGSACAFDLLQNADVEEVRIADKNVTNLPAFLKPYLGKRLTAHTLDANDADAVAKLVRGTKAAMCAMPYHFNLALAHVAVQNKVHFCDPRRKHRHRVQAA